ncbi:MAG: hypothetical protein ACXWW0_06840 [Bacteroidia bacterium]
MQQGLLMYYSNRAKEYEAVNLQIFKSEIRWPGSNIWFTIISLMGDFFVIFCHTVILIYRSHCQVIFEVEKHIYLIY